MDDFCDFADRVAFRPGWGVPDRGGHLAASGRCFGRPDSAARFGASNGSVDSAL